MKKLAILLVGNLWFISSAIAQDVSYASDERRDAAIGHYSRARALLVEAVREFEEGRRLAGPDLLVDPQMWKSSVVSRAEELNRVLDPRPRITKSGVRYKAISKLTGIGSVTKDIRDSNSDAEEATSGEPEAKKPAIDETYDILLEDNSAKPTPAAKIGGVIPPPELDLNSNAGTPPAPEKQNVMGEIQKILQEKKQQAVAPAVEAKPADVAPAQVPAQEKSSPTSQNNSQEDEELADLFKD